MLPTSRQSPPFAHPPGKVRQSHVASTRQFLKTAIRRSLIEQELLRTGSMNIMSIMLRGRPFVPDSQRSCSSPSGSQRVRPRGREGALSKKSAFRGFSIRLTGWLFLPIQNLRCQIRPPAISGRLRPPGCEKGGVSAILTGCARAPLHGPAKANSRHIKSIRQFDRKKGGMRGNEEIRKRSSEDRS